MEVTWLLYFYMLLGATILVAMLMNHLRPSPYALVRVQQHPSASADSLCPEAKRAVEQALWHWERSRWVGDEHCERAFAWLTNAFAFAPYLDVQLYLSAHPNDGLLFWCAYDSPGIGEFD